MLRTPMDHPAQGGRGSRVWRRRFGFSRGDPEADGNLRAVDELAGESTSEIR